MIRLNLVLLLAVVVSAVYLVSVQYDSRRLVTELHRAENDAKRLAIEFDRLQVEKRTQATPSRVELIAREKLQMLQVTPGVTTYVTYSVPQPGASASAAGAAASTGGKTP
ncbi:MAG: cell division protein FtsL [Rhodoferax sp.]|nr:cell division protein FtsL [Rhodoferax sp.]MCF8212140.1 cell division protein FtsL [Rhodoferax sp.]